MNIGLNPGPRARTVKPGPRHLRTRPDPQISGKYSFTGIYSRKKNCAWLLLSLQPQAPTTQQVILPLPLHFFLSPSSWSPALDDLG